MFSVTVRDHVMIAHSLRGEVFGPAQRLHGATYLVDATFCRPSLDADSLVVDIGRAATALGAVLAELGYRNLDDDPSLAGTNTTTEAMAQVVGDRLAARIDDGDLGDGGRGLTRLVVTLRESHVAWASYEREAVTVHIVVPDAYDDPRRPSGGNVYDRRLCEELEHLGWPVRVRSVPGPWPDADDRGRRALAGVLAAVPAGDPVIIDGLVGSGLPDAVLPQVDRLRLVVLVHLPLGAAAGADPGTRARERAVLERCAVVVTSRWAQRWLHDHYQLPPGTVVVAEPGVDRAALVAGTASGGHLLCVGAVTPIKGHDVLVGALSAVRDLDWVCTCVGSTAIDPGFAYCAAAAARRLGIGQRVRVVGPLGGSQLAAAYADADLLVLPSRAETYGMVVTEALARGVPVVASDVGGVPEALGSAGGAAPGMLVRSESPATLAEALRSWLSDAGLREELRRRARIRRIGLSSWSTTAARVARVLAAVTGAPAGVEP